MNDPLLHRDNQLVILGDKGTGRIDSQIRMWLSVVDGMRRQGGGRTATGHVLTNGPLVELLMVAQNPRGSVWSAHACAN